MKRWIFILLLPLILLTGCSKSPLEQLKSNSNQAGLNPPFWHEVRVKHPALWKKAVNYCKKYGEKPNCGEVMEIYIIMNGSTTPPPANDTAGRIKLPAAL